MQFKKQMADKYLKNEIEKLDFFSGIIPAHRWYFKSVIHAAVKAYRGLCVTPRLRKTSPFPVL